MLPEGDKMFQYHHVVYHSASLWVERVLQEMVLDQIPLVSNYFIMISPIEKKQSCKRNVTALSNDLVKTK